MGLLYSSSSSSHLEGGEEKEDEEEPELRLYQAFIFSIPILFSIILLLLFYVFYLKRRIRRRSILNINTNFHHHQTLPITSTTTTTTAQPSSSSYIFRAKLQTILVDEDFIRTKDKLYVCLGDFQIGEDLHQLPTCTHVFHADCILLWLSSTSTCPLCRTQIIP
ncbi:probable E3 ubiquitin-protein ligase RHA4A [Impatiens glandulifera]|uniref:probable E3 ubiquitin-protein ligase RHA4A n=1 Tax=Impatiens glandulifera TaxID=253017 RepID=UPI001FB072B8|nr:probable E3 ubiquitin-protein ligase RHA4A [Impatiens glandulifera]